MTVYEEILDRAKQLSSEERLRLADLLLEDELGFGMWRDRADIVDATTYVEELREANMRWPDGSLKSPEGFLREVETFDE
jgi:hypothetical protein